MVIQSFRRKGALRAWTFVPVRPGDQSKITLIVTYGLFDLTSKNNSSKLLHLL